MENLQRILNLIRTVLDFPLIHFGESQLTFWSIIVFFVFLTLLLMITSKIKKWIVFRALAKSNLDAGARYAIGSIVRYIAIAVGFVIILQTAGIDLSALTILLGSLSIGIGLGLQNITNNFVSGLIILIERPIKVGDRIEIGNLNGDVVQISARSTRIITNDNVAVIVPNSELISSPVVNWSYPTKSVRFNIPVGVSYDSDPEMIKQLLVEIAGSHPGVLQSQPPDVLFDSFGENTLNFILRVWTEQYLTKPGVLRSELYYEISKKFKEKGIQIPFPQREVRIIGKSQD